MPDGLKAFLQLYDETLAAVENNDARVVSDIKKAKANQKKHTVVAPLLGDHISGSKVSDVYLSANIPTTLSLPVGMYIVNGRKIVVNAR